MKLKRKTYYHDDESGFNFAFEPIEDTLTITQNGDQYEARYLTNDEYPESPDEWGDDSLFLVNYHRDFWVERPSVLSKDDLANWYRKDFSEYEDEKFPLEDDYHIFPVSCLIHSGVWLSLGKGFSCDPGGWDTSRVGAIFASKKEYPTEEAAFKAAEGVINVWNQYLQGNVYCCVKEVYDKDKTQVDYDLVGGFYGYDYALTELSTM